MVCRWSAEKVEIKIEKTQICKLQLGKNERESSRITRKKNKNRFKMNNNKNSRFILCILILLVSLSASLCAGYQIGKGKFESFNGNRYTEAKSMSDSENATKTFFSLNRNRPPSHDTPASPCSCSKFRRIPKINSNRKIEKISRWCEAK